MSDRIKNDDDVLQKSDLDTILQVNKKAIELHTEISDQFEEILSSNQTTAREHEKIKAGIDKVVEDIKDLKKDVKELTNTQFKILLLLSTGIVSLLIQVISIISGIKK